MGAYVLVGVFAGIAGVVIWAIIRQHLKGRKDERDRQAAYDVAFKRRCDEFQARIERDARIHRPSAPPKRTPQKPTKYVGANNPWSNDPAVPIYALLIGDGDGHPLPDGTYEHFAALPDSWPAEACNAQSFAPDSGYSCDAPSDPGSSCDSGGGE